MTKTLVIKSIEIEDGLRCVDVFRRGDGSYGFEEYRRDPEDRRGWYATGGFFALRFATGTDALKQARANLPWLRDNTSE